MTGPLVGLRALDLTTGVAGPYMTKLLADHGVDVIKVEPPGGDPARQDGPFFRDIPHPEGSGRFLFLNTNKRSIVLDLLDAGDRALIRSLVTECDLVVEDQPPGRLAALGLGYADLDNLSPGIVLVSITPWGQSGPYLDYRLTDLIAQAMGGPMLWTGSAEREPLRIGGGGAVALYQAGAVAALAVMFALYHRQQTGEGQQIELAQAENFLPMLAELILDWTMNQHDPSPWGNRHRSHAPHNVYPCRGEDQWIAIDIGTDAEFAALCRTLDLPHLIDDPRFADAASRWTNQTDLDPLLAAQTRAHDKFDLMRRLQAAGVAAGPLQSAAERLACPQLLARGFFEELENDAAGRHPYPGLLWRMARTPNRLRRAPVTLGQDNDYVYRNLLGMSADEYEQRTTAGTIASRYLPEAFAALGG